MYKYICRLTEVNLCLKVNPGRFKINVSLERFSHAGLLKNERPNKKQSLDL